jgi:hypothetical protein
MREAERVVARTVDRSIAKAARLCNGVTRQFAERKSLGEPVV